MRIRSCAMPPEIMTDNNQRSPVAIIRLAKDSPQRWLCSEHCKIVRGNKFGIQTDCFPAGLCPCEGRIRLCGEQINHAMLLPPQQEILVRSGAAFQAFPKDG